MIAIGSPLLVSIALLVSPADDSGGIIALVNGKAITYRYFQKRATPIIETVPLGQRDAVLRQQYEDMIDEHVLLDLAKQDDLKVSESEIDERVRDEIQIQRNKHRVNIADEEDYYRAIQERHGLTREEWREETRNQLLIEKLYRAKVFRQQIFSAEEMRAFYRNHPKEFLKGGEILFRRISIPRDLEGREGILKEIEAQIAAGTPFATLVARYSFGAGAGDGGVWRAVYGLPEDRPLNPEDVAFESLTPALREALETLKPGETSGRIELSTVTMIVRVEKSEKPVRLSFEEALPAIKGFLRRIYWEERRKEFVREARAQADVKTFFRSVPS
ncbi:MAG: peptidyl-prolyl cis-trans isomerase [Planctomycetes bacterium]|nr:peptidyl-prolyl cis-trans isomerase [Planctomycetota bacterium]